MKKDMNKIKKMEIFAQNPIYAITAEKLSHGRTNIEIVAEILNAGIKVIQYREKEKSAKERYQECVALRKLTREHDALFLIDDFVDLALLVDADGVHLGQDDLPVEEVRHLLGSDKIIGLSTHSERDILEAKKLALQNIINYIGVGPVFETHTKENPAPTVGLKLVNFARENICVPFVAIGGIKERNIQDVRKAGAIHIALVSEIVGAKNIAEKIVRLMH